MEKVEEALKLYQDEVATATWTFYAWKHLNNAGFNDRAVRRGLNRNAATWNVITHSLQTTFFITIGRLFDIDGDAFSVHAFLRFCIDNVEQFDSQHIRERKIADQNGIEPDWLDDYMERVYEAQEEDFQRLRGEVSKNITKRSIGLYETRSWLTRRLPPFQMLQKSLVEQILAKFRIF